MLVIQQTDFCEKCAGLLDEGGAVLVKKLAAVIRCAHVAVQAGEDLPAYPRYYQGSKESKV